MRVPQKGGGGVLGSPLDPPLGLIKTNLSAHLDEVCLYVVECDLYFDMERPILTRVELLRLLALLRRHVGKVGRLVWRGILSDVVCELLILTKIVFLCTREIGKTLDFVYYSWGGGLIWSIRPTGLVDEGFPPICHVTSYECYIPASISYFLVDFHVLSLLKTCWKHINRGGVGGLQCIII